MVSMSERSRPYLKLGTQELEALFAAHHDDFNVVDDIHFELAVRTTPRAARLRGEAEVTLQQLSSTGEPASDHARDTPADKAIEGAGDDALDGVVDEPDEDVAVSEEYGAVLDPDHPSEEYDAAVEPAPSTESFAEALGDAKTPVTAGPDNNSASIVSADIQRT